jgi:hypothetical protein
MEISCKHISYCDIGKRRGIQRSQLLHLQLRNKKWVFDYVLNAISLIHQDNRPSKNKKYGRNHKNSSSEAEKSSHPSKDTTKIQGIYSN